MSISPEVAAAVIAAFIIPFLAAFFKASGIGNPVKQYVEFVLALIIAYGTLVVLGKIPFLPNVGTDPTMWFTILGQYFAVITALAMIVYNLLQSQIQKFGTKYRRQ